MKRMTDKRLAEIEEFVGVAETKWVTELWVGMLRGLLDETRRLRTENEKFRREMALEQDARSTEV